MRHLKKLEMLAIMMVVCIISGCASVPTVSPQFEQAERSFTLPSGMASVYIYRPYNYLWSGLVLDVTIDDKELGKFIPTTCLLGNIVPGKHVIKVNRWMEGVDSSGIVKELDAEPGKIYFFKIIPGWWRNFKIKQVNEKEGLSEISRMISPLNLAREEWDTLKNIAIVPARFLPEVDEIRPYFPEGRMSGALKGASDGAAIGARIFMGGMTDSLGALFFMMLGTLAGGVVGAVDGAIGADPKKSEAEIRSISETDKVIKQGLRELKIQETLAVRVQEVGKKETNKEFVIVQDTGPTSPTDQPDYAALFAQGVDAVLELSVRNIGSDHRWEEGQHLVNFYMNVHTRLVCGTESHIREFNYLIGASPRTYDKWIEVGPEAFQKEVDNNYKSLAKNIIEFFVR